MRKRRTIIVEEIPEHPKAGCGTILAAFFACIAIASSYDKAKEESSEPKRIEALEKETSKEMEQTVLESTYSFQASTNAASNHNDNDYSAEKSSITRETIEDTATDKDVEYALKGLNSIYAADNNDEELEEEEEHKMSRREQRKARKRAREERRRAEQESE